MSECDSSFGNAGNAGKINYRLMHTITQTQRLRMAVLGAKFTTFYKLRTNRLITIVHVPSGIHPLTISQDEHFGDAARVSGAFTAHLEFI